MADLFLIQGKEYSAGRPEYPPDLFQFIADKSPDHRLAWDVGTGTGQAAAALATIFSDVVATDTSPNQLSFAPNISNIRYIHTPNPSMTPDTFFSIFGVGAAAVDAITVAQALHWFDLPSFYSLVRYVSKPGAVLAAWCYTLPVIGPRVDRALRHVYAAADPYWASERKLVEEEYRTIDFPFGPADGEDHTGPFEFAFRRPLDLAALVTYVRSWSSYQLAKKAGVELLDPKIVAEFEEAWREDGGGAETKVATYPIFLRLGKVND